MVDEAALFFWHAAFYICAPATIILLIWMAYRYSKLKKAPASTSSVAWHGSLIPLVVAVEVFTGVSLAWRAIFVIVNPLIVLISIWFLVRLFVWDRTIEVEQEATEEAQPQVPTDTFSLNDIDDYAFRTAAGEVIGKDPSLGPQLLLDYRSYVKPTSKDFLTAPDLSSIEFLAKRYPGETTVYPAHWLKAQGNKAILNSPFSVLLNDVPERLLIPIDTRFEHTWILGVTGSGKTQLMSFLMSKDFDTDASVMVIDSQGDLIRTIAGLRHIRDRVILVEPGEIGLNPFTLKGDQAIDLLTFVFSAMGEGAELTPRQATLYRYSIRLLQEVPNATLSTFMHLLRPDGLSSYTSYLSRLSEPARLFFQDEFQSREFKEVKEQVGWRLKLLLENPTFARMFNSTSMKLNLAEALNEGKIVLIDTNKDKLGSERSAIFGRFFVALLLLAAQGRRETVRRDTFVYIDEAWELLSDNKVAEILDQARKYKIGMVLANQRTSQITNPNMLQALTTTAIKYVSTDDDRDTHMLARPMKTEPEFLASMGKLTFAAYVRGTTDTAKRIEVPVGVLEAMPKAPLEPLRTKMRELYGVEDAREPEPEDEEDDEDIKPSSKL